MKSHILASVSAATLLMAGPAFAQSSGAPTSAAAANSTTQSNSSVSSSIDQVGDNNSATVNQNDASVASKDQDSSVIVQGFPSANAPSNNNSANVTQSGPGEQSLVMQASTTSTSEQAGQSAGAQANTATVNQSGADQSAFAYQYGSNNSATIQQAQSDTYGTAPPNPQGVSGASDSQSGINAAVALRETSVPTIENTVEYSGIGGNATTGAGVADIVQDWAVNNTAQITQSTDANRAVIAQAFQTGSNASVSQGGDGFYGNDGWISQQGVNNTGAGFNTAKLTQNGSNDGASIEQMDSIGSYASTTQQAGSEYSVAFTYQSGAGEASTISQDGPAGVSSISVAQTGGMDRSDVTQDSTDGAANTVTVNQGLASAWSHVAQTGGGNTATVNQGAPAAFLTPRN